MEKVEFILSGKVVNVVRKEYENKETMTLQFLNVKNDKMEVIDIKVEEPNNFKDIKIGDKVKLNIDINLYNGKLYYKTNSLVK